MSGQENELGCLACESINLFLKRFTALLIKTICSSCQVTRRMNTANMQWSGSIDCPFLFFVYERTVHGIKQMHAVRMGNNREITAANQSMMVSSLICFSTRRIVSALN